MAVLEARGFDAPDETRAFERGRMDVVTLGGATIGRAVFEPGWKWSTCVGPVAGTANCQVSHTDYVVSGRVHVVMDDGAEGEAGEGDAFVISPGHDAWTVGDEPCVIVDVQGAAKYGRGR